jgi:tRNA (mo5U34)-methyltransferase
LPEKPGSAKDPGRLLARIRELDPWFHDIDLGAVLKTKLGPCADEPDDHPRPTWALLKAYLPADLSGQSVLDAGCNAGFYSFETKKLGAKSVLGIDAQRREIAQARLAAEVLELDVTFRRSSVYDLSIAELGQFDLVLALGLLYHCRHPLLALERLFEVTRGTLIVESAVAPEEWTGGARTRSIGGLLRRLVPAFYIENDSNSAEAVYNWFLPTPTCLAALLSSVGFGGIRHVAISADRSLFVCTRRGDASDDGRAGSYRARLIARDPDVSASAAGEIALAVRLWNTGTATWEASAGRQEERGAVLLGIHLLDEAENVLELDYLRYRGALYERVRPGECIDMDVRFASPAAAGRYLLELDLVREFEGWFEDVGGTPLRVGLVVREKAIS